MEGRSGKSLKRGRRRRRKKDLLARCGKVQGVVNAHGGNAVTLNPTSSLRLLSHSSEIQATKREEEERRTSAQRQRGE